MKTHISKNPTRRAQLERYSGDCLEAIGIPSEGFVVIDRACSFGVGDVVMCARIAGSISPLLKQVASCGESVTVRTRYMDPARDFSFVAEEIFGVLRYVLDCDLNIVWSREDAQSAS